MRKAIGIVAGVLALYAVLTWFMGDWLNLQGARLWILRGSLFLIGLAAAALVVWFFWNRHKQAGQAASEDIDAPGQDEVSGLIREAAGRLPKSRGRLGSLPVVFVVGESRSAKTSVIVHSGLHPELLAGQVFREEEVVPTRALNIWFGNGALFVEAAGKFLEDPKAWVRIARGVQPRGLGSAVTTQAAGATSVVVTVDCEAVLHPASPQAMETSARRLRARLIEISQTIGINLPVYVLFTRGDRVPFFAEFTKNLTDAEAQQVLGATVPMSGNGGGVYAQQEALRLSAEFEKLFRSLCGYRPDVLAREFDAANLPGVYEFPRELRKLRTNLVQFLVDLCRPSQLTVGPFLRGFYFSGVRPQTVTEAAPAQRPAAAPVPADGATRMFRPDMLAAATGSAAAPVSKRVPQWIFLTDFFHRVLLGDGGAKAVSGASTRTSLLRRVLLISTCAVFAIYSIGAAVSWVRNRSLAARVQNAAEGLRGAGPASDLAGLRRLETLRAALAQVTAYHRSGAPLSLHWGLYSADDIYPEARRLYFENFRRMLLAPTQTILAGSLNSLPASPGPEYGPVYDSLKGYLITTANPEKSTRAFLSPVLTARWSATRQPGDESLEVARRQFDFYSDELSVDDPFSRDNDGAAVAHGRRYLNQFAGLDRVYAAMLSDTAKNTQPINFNRRFPGSAETVVDGYEIPGAFTKQGWDAIKNALANPERYFSGERWVLGDGTQTIVDKEKLAAQLTVRYRGDYVKHWRAYLHAAGIVKYANIQDAAKKLNIIAGNQSPLLALFAIASQNTAVDAAEVANLFQPVQSVVSPATVDRYIGPSNQTYMTALLQLQTTLDTAAQAPDLNDQVAAPVLANASAARIATKQSAQAFRADSEGHVDAQVERLMEEPITSVESLLRRLGPEELNARGKQFCGPYRALWSKYPFNSAATAPQASVAEVNAIFRPGDGALWTLYETGLKKILTKNGSRFEPAAAAAAVKVSPAFLNFFNEAAALSEAWYGGGAHDPHFVYMLKPVASEGIEGLTIDIDGQRMSYTGGPAMPKQFTWQGKEQNQARASVRLGSTDLGWFSRDGLWSAFHFFGEAERRRPAGDAEDLEWIARTGAGAMTLPNGKPLTVSLELTMQGAPPVFRKGYFSGMGCVAEVAR